MCSTIEPDNLFIFANEIESTDFTSSSRNKKGSPTFSFTLNVLLLRLFRTNQMFLKYDCCIY